MKEKKAFINAAFGAMEAIDGVKKTNQAYKNTDNKYDDLMGTKLVKAPKVMGNQNSIVAGKSTASNSPKLASEELSNIYKEAKLLNKNSLGTLKTVVDNFDAKNTQHLKNTVGAIKNKQFMNALHHGARAIPGTALGAGLIAGSGVGATKLLKKIDGTNNPQNNVEYNTIGGAVSAGMALSALGNKRMLLPASKALGILAKQTAKIPVNTVKNTPVGKVMNAFGQSVKATASQANKTTNDISFLGSNIEKLMGQGKTFEEASKTIFDQQISNIKNQNWQLGKTDPSKLQDLIASRTKELSNSFESIKSLLNKKASSEVDELYKIAGAKTEYLQDVIKKKFFKSGLESLPYYAGTAIVGHAIDSSVKRRIKDAELYRAKQEYLKNKETQTPKVQEKVASAEAIFFKNPKVNKVFKNSLESAVEGVGRMTIPLAASTLIGRDITKSLRKIDRGNINSDGVTTDENSIQLSRSERASIQDMISDKNEQTKTAGESQSNNDEVAQQIMRRVEKEIIKGDTKLNGEKIHIGNGVKKQFRMIPSQGMHGLHGMVE